MAVMVAGMAQIVILITIIVRCRTIDCGVTARLNRENVGLNPLSSGYRSIIAMRENSESHKMLDLLIFRDQSMRISSQIRLKR
jgi:hypothetical protein